MTMGERIATLRKMKNLTQKQLADKLQVSDKAVSKWESGRGEPSLELIRAITKLFNCSIDYLVDGKDRVSYLMLDENFAEGCFAELREKVSEEEYNEVFKNFTFMGLERGSFVFETTNKALLEKYDESEEDTIFDELVKISMSKDYNINGYTLALVGPEAEAEKSTKQGFEFIITKCD